MTNYDNSIEWLTVEEGIQLFKDYIERAKRIKEGKALDDDLIYDKWEKKWLREHGKASWTLNKNYMEQRYRFLDVETHT